MGAARARAPVCGPRSVGHAMGRGRFLMCAPEMELPGPRLFRAGEEASRLVSMVSASPEPARPPPPPLSGADTRPSHALQVVRRDMKSVFYISPNVERSQGGARVHRRRRVRSWASLETIPGALESSLARGFDGRDARGVPWRRSAHVARALGRPLVDRVLHSVEPLYNMIYVCVTRTSYHAKCQSCASEIF